MLVCLVGGAGYVGSVLARHLADSGHKVVVVDNFMFGRQGYDGARGHLEVKEHDCLISCFGKTDVTRIEPGFFEEVRRTMERDNGEPYALIDVVVHLAGFSNDPTAEFRPDINYELNVTTVGKVANAARLAGIRRFVYASSCSIYHSAEAEYDVEVTEKFPVKPSWHYSVSKYAGELAALAFNRPGEFDVVVARKGTVCGPSYRMRYDLMLNAMFRSAMTRGVVEVHGGGWMSRPLLGITDAARAYRTLIEAPGEAVSGQVFNVVSQNRTVREYAAGLVLELNHLREMNGSASPHLVDSVKLEVTPTPFGQVRSYRVSARKIKETLGWEPKENFESLTEDLYYCLPGTSAVKKVWAFSDVVLPPFDDESTDNIKVVQKLYGPGIWAR
jgi:nucleoside-diphosphate-sugar epimerase